MAECHTPPTNRIGELGPSGPSVADAIAEHGAEAQERLGEARENFQKATDELAEDAEVKAGFATDLGGYAADHIGLTEERAARLQESESVVLNVGGSIMVVARGIIIAVVALIVLSALYSTDIVANPENNNSWTQMFDTFADYGTTAFTLIGVGLIAVGAGVALSYFGNMGAGGMGGGR